MSHKEQSSVHKVIAMLKNSLNGLGYQLSATALEQMGLFIFVTMEGKNRQFHVTKHLFDVSQDMNPCQSLAALFHDLVYYQIDKGYPPQAAELLLPFIAETANNLLIKADAPAQVSFDLCLNIFGFSRGQELGVFTGQNEFLSALVAALLLNNLLTTKDLATVVACIEATIPFRKKDAAGKSCYDKLAERLNQYGATQTPTWQPAEVDTMVQQAVILANNDVKNFAAEDVGVFLDGTWNLLPEIHTALRQRGIYTIKSYRNALDKMEAFFHFLQADNIFHQYKNVPHQADYQVLIERTTENLRISKLYLGVKLLPIAIIEAAAELTGGDAPLSFFVGDVQVQGQNLIRAEDFLPSLVELPNLQADKDETVFHLLAYGRKSPTHFDLQNSPISAYVYQVLGADRCNILLESAKEFFVGKLTAKEFLSTQDSPTQEVIVAVIKACASIAETRTASLLTLAEKTSQNSAKN
jgi:hypothetical protein